MTEKLFKIDTEVIKKSSEETYFQKGKNEPPQFIKGDGQIIQKTSTDQLVRYYFL
jgi:hypothetical protein